MRAATAAEKHTPAGTGESSLPKAADLLFGGGLKVSFAWPLFGKTVPLLLVAEASWEPWTRVKLEASFQSGAGTPTVAGGVFFYLQNRSFGNHPSAGFSLIGGRGYAGGVTLLLEDRHSGRGELFFGAGIGVAGTVPIWVFPLGSSQWGS